MDGWLKFLVAVACCVVIGAGGYFAWGEWQESRRAAEIKQLRTAARMELFRIFKADAGDDAKIRQYCGFARKSRLMTTDEANDRVKELCSFVGY